MPDTRLADLIESAIDSLSNWPKDYECPATPDEIAALHKKYKTWGLGHIRWIRTEDDARAWVFYQLLLLRGLN
jgi:hypothetical protein